MCLFWEVENKSISFNVKNVSNTTMKAKAVLNEENQKEKCINICKKTSKM